MLPIVSSSPCEGIRDFIKADTLYTFELDNVLTIRALMITNRLRHPGPPIKTLSFLLVNGFQFHQKIDYIGRDVCVWRRKEPFAEPMVSATQAQAYFLTEILPTWVHEVIVYEEENVVAMTVPKLFPGGFGSNSSGASFVVEKLLMQGFVTGKRVDTPIGHYWIYSRTAAYVPALAAQAVALEYIPPGQAAAHPASNSNSQGSGSFPPPSQASPHATPPPPVSGGGGGASPAASPVSASLTSAASSHSFASSTQLSPSPPSHDSSIVFSPQQ